MNGKVKILFFCMVFVAGPTFGQKNTLFRPQFDRLKYYKMAQLKPLQKINLPLIIAANNKLASTFRLTGSEKDVTVLPSNYYAANLGFFCKKELQLEKITSIPFKFRLGSVQQCDWLEGKNVAITQ